MAFPHPQPKETEVFRCGAVETNPTRNHEVADLSPGLAQWVKDLALLWLWCTPAATAPIGPLAWEPLYAVGAALKSQKKKKRKIQKNEGKVQESLPPVGRPDFDNTSFTHVIFPL